MQLAIWRTGLAGALLAVATGCATTPRQRQITWNVLKWKTTDAATAAPLMDKGDVVLRGQSLQTRTTYSVPVTVEFETQLQKREAGAGMFSLMFVPTGQSTNAEPEEFVAVMLQHSTTGETLVVMQRSGTPRQDETIFAQPVTPPSGQPCRLKIEAANTGMHLTLNAQVYEIPPAKVPYNKFYIDLSTMPASDNWRVRNFAIR